MRSLCCKVWEYYIVMFFFLLLRGLRQDGCLIEATFSVPESAVRGWTIQYKYAVHQRQKQTMEIAVRFVEIPADNTVKGTKIWKLFFGLFPVHGVIIMPHLVVEFSRISPLWRLYKLFKSRICSRLVEELVSVWRKRHLQRLGDLCSCVTGQCFSEMAAI